MSATQQPRPTEESEEIQATATEGNPIFYDGLYAPSGFDFMAVLIRVASRPNPQIDIGSVDCNAAIIVCDTFKSDTPIIYCSEAFTHLTGYEEREVLGRNCRFLQSPPPSVERQTAQLSHDYTAGGVSSSWSEILRVRSALARREEVQVTLRNYTKTGAPFANFEPFVMTGASKYVHGDLLQASQAFQNSLSSAYLPPRDHTQKRLQANVCGIKKRDSGGDFARIDEDLLWTDADSSTAMDSLAATGDNQERGTDAEKLEEKRLEAFIKLMDDMRPNTLTIMGNLATWYQSQARRANAEALEEKILEACINLYGEAHSNTLTAMGNLAATYAILERWAEEERLKEKVIDVRSRWQGEDYPETVAIMEDLALVYVTGIELV